MIRHYACHCDTLFLKTNHLITQHLLILEAGRSRYCCHREIHEYFNNEIQKHKAIAVISTGLNKDLQQLGLSLWRFFTVLITKVAPLSESTELIETLLKYRVL